MLNSLFKYCVLLLVTVLYYSCKADCKDNTQTLSESYKKINQYIADKNFKSIQKGDCFSVMFAVEKDMGRHIFFRPGYPYSHNYSDITDDSLALKLQLEDKYYGHRLDLTVDSAMLMFKVKIISMGDTGIVICGDKRKVGDDFEFDIVLYGREIKPEIE